MKDVANNNDRLLVWVGAGVVLAVIVLAGFVVLELGAANPGGAVAAITALTALLAAVPPIIRALRGR